MKRLSKKLIMLLFLTILSPASIVAIDAANQQDDPESNSADNLLSVILTTIEKYAVFIGGLGIGSAVVTGLWNFLSISKEAKITEHYKIRSLYNESYTKWLIQIHGSIREFRELCHDIKNSGPIYIPNPTKRLGNPVYVITHVWEMHKEAEDGYKWIGVIEKMEKKPDVSHLLNQVFDRVDQLWHYLENTNALLLGKQSMSDDRRLILSLLSSADKQHMADRIIQTIKNDAILSDYNFRKIEDFLLEKIPKGSRRWAS